MISVRNVSPPSKASVVARKTIQQRAYSVVCATHIVVLLNRKRIPNGIADSSANEYEYYPGQHSHCI